MPFTRKIKCRFGYHTIIVCIKFLTGIVIEVPADEPTLKDYHNDLDIIDYVTYKCYWCGKDLPNMYTGPLEGKGLKK